MSASLRIAACDLNGQARGKRLSDDYAAKLHKTGARMPLSALNLDLTGADIEDSPLVFATGDADGVLRTTGRGPVPMPWLSHGAMLEPMWMFTDDGVPFAGDPRHALARMLDRYAAHGWSPVAATELEFYLVDAKGLAPTPPDEDWPMEGDRILSLATLDAFDGFLTDVFDGAKAMGITPQSAIAESGVSQFEITLNHTDAMRMADDCWLMKQLIRGTARKHGYAATFLAKPMSDAAGSGMHVHYSVLDQDGHNIFDDGSPEGSDTLRSAVAGCLAAMPPATLIFAPHLTSYARFVDGAHAPTTACWGYENRTAAIRIPGGPPAARRIEHRVAGADINPYLLLSAILGSALIGIEQGLTPPAAITGNAYGVDAPYLAATLADAVEAFATAPEVAAVFDPLLIDNLARTKHQEIAHLGTLPHKDLMRISLEAV